MINLKHVPAATPRRSPGRPTKFTPPVVKRILRCLQRGMPMTLTADAVGVSYQALSDYRKRNARFAAALARAIARGADARLRKIEAASAAGDWRAAAWLLEHCQPEHFAKNRIEVSGPDGAPLAGVVAVYLPQKDGHNGEPRAVTVEEPRKELTNGH